MATPRLDSRALSGADGGPLRVSVRTGARPGEKRPAIVICHGFKGFKDWGFFPRTAERLATAGFTVWTFNFSGSGVGDGDQFDEPERWANQRPTADLADLATVMTQARSEGATWIGLLGHSRGGGMAILHAARDPGVGALVTWAAIDDFNRFSKADVERWRRTGKLDVVNQRTGQVLTIDRGALDDYDRHKDGALDVAAAASQVAVPWLILHGTGDQSVDVGVAHRLTSLSKSARTELLLLDGADHTLGIRHPWAGSTEDFDQALEHSAGFMMQAMRGK